MTSKEQLMKIIENHRKTMKNQRKSNNGKPKAILPAF